MSHTDRNTRREPAERPFPYVPSAVPVTVQLGDVTRDHAIGAFQPGMRVELHPATDAWMRGDRYGDVVNVGRELVHVKMDRSGKTRKIHPRNIGQIIR